MYMWDRLYYCAGRKHFERHENLNIIGVKGKNVAKFNIHTNKSKFCEWISICMYCDTMPEQGRAKRKKCNPWASPIYHEKIESQLGCHLLFIIIITLFLPIFFF